MSKLSSYLMIGGVDFLALVVLAILQYICFYGTSYTIEQKERAYLLDIAKYICFGVIGIWVVVIVANALTKYENKYVMQSKIVPLILFSIATCFLIPFVWDKGTISDIFQPQSCGLILMICSYFLQKCQLKQMENATNQDLDVNYNNMPNKQLIPQFNY